MTHKDVSATIVEFLTEHPLISVNALEVELGMPQSTIGQALGGGRDIPRKYIYELICILCNYGLSINDVSFTYDPIISTLFGRKFLDNVETIEDGNSFEYIVKEARIVAMTYEDLLSIL